MILKALSSRGYKPQSSNYGDCILIDTGSELIIYDCGSEKHARRVEEYMSEHGYKQAIAFYRTTTLITMMDFHT